MTRKMSVLEREMRVRGTTMESFAGELGLSSEQLEAMVKGGRKMPPSVRLQFVEALGVSPEAFRN